MEKVVTEIGKGEGSETEDEMDEWDYQTRVRDSIGQILQAAFKSKDLKMFLDKIVEVGAEKTEAKSCAIFLLEEPDDGNGDILRVYAASGEVGEVLKEKEAWYYVPKRDVFKDPGEGRSKVETYVKKHFEAAKEKTSAMDTLREEGKSLMSIVEDISREQGKTQEQMLIQLVENGELPMGITAYVVKEKESVILHGNTIRLHREWRGSYEGHHEICMSLVEVPLTREGRVIGVIKIENRKQGETKRFMSKHQEILKILADCVIIAIQNILYEAPTTYKKVFGTKILKMIDKLEIDNQVTPSVIHRLTCNIDIHDKLRQFYGQLKTEIEDISGIDEIFDQTTRLVSQLAQILNLQNTLSILANVGPAFESLLGTDVLYREHFIHQFQVFLLGYYLVNKKSSLQKKLLEHLNACASSNTSYNINDLLRVWFVTSMFHDFAYSAGEIEKWLKRYFDRVQIPPKFRIDWPDILTHYEIEKTKLVALISRKSGQPEDKIAKIIRDAFMKEDDHDHGVLSGLVLMSVLHDKIEATPLDETLLKEICCAIVLHSDSVYSKFGRKQLRISKLPLAFLLVYCDSAQQWGRPRMMTLSPDIDVKLEDIIIDGCKKVETKLRYQNVTDEQKRLVLEKTLLPTTHWYSEETPKFSIGLYEGSAVGHFEKYTFPSIHTPTRTRGISKGANDRSLQKSSKENRNSKKTL